MYYPYLRGKQFELILLRDNSNVIAKYVHPIIEPVRKDFKSLGRAIEVLTREKVLFTLIVNPITGENPVYQESILTFIENSPIDLSTISLG